MSYYEFFKNCLRATKDKYEKLLKTPKARGKQYEIEKREIIRQIHVSEDFGEITHSEAKLLISEFDCIRFDELPKARKEINRKGVQRKYE